MNLCRLIIPSILASLCLLAVPITAPAQVNGEKKPSPRRRRTLKC